MDPVYLSDLTAAESHSVHGGCSKGTVFESGPAQVAMFRVPPGRQIAAHRHSVIWDLFIGISGDGAIVVDTDEGSRSYRLSRSSFCAMPPGVTHTVVNSGDETLEFALTHAPWDGYDHIRVTGEAD